MKLSALSISHPLLSRSDRRDGSARSTLTGRFRRTSSRSRNLPALAPLGHPSYSLREQEGMGATDATILGNPLVVT